MPFWLWLLGSTPACNGPAVNWWDPAGVRQEDGVLSVNAHQPPLTLLGILGWTMNIHEAEIIQHFHKTN